MLKKLLFLVILALPLVASASSIDISNSGGTLTGSSGGFTLTGSVIFKYDTIAGNNLGSLSFTTGAFTSGDAQMGGTLAPGGTFEIMGNGTGGVPNGVIFSGTFSAATWTLVTLQDGTHNYTLTGALVDASGRVGATTQITINTGTSLFGGSTRISSGDTNLNAQVPEPGALSLLATGLIGIAFIYKRKFA